MFFAMVGGNHERLYWSGLALTRRDYLNGKEVVSSERYLNEPHPGGGNPVLVWEGKATPASAKEQARAAATRLLFNDMLGSTISVIDGDRAQATNMTLFGETPDGQGAGFFTGKPHIDELGYAFLFRNYRPDKAKWQTADPLGYPDGWNALAYCGNGVNLSVDFIGAFKIEWDGKWNENDKTSVIQSIDSVLKRCEDLLTQSSLTFDKIKKCASGNSMYILGLLYRVGEFKSLMRRMIDNISSENLVLRISIEYEKGTSGSMWPPYDFGLNWIDWRMVLSPNSFNAIDSTIMHEISHTAGTVDKDDSYGCGFNNAHSLEKLLSSDFESWFEYKRLLLVTYENKIDFSKCCDE